jgi:MoaA/NifB/PqqE/SkfB family radical SAM enzyme
MIDVLFVTRLSNPESTEIADTYQDLRLAIGGRTATVDHLRRLAAASSPGEAVGPDGGGAFPPVLTPIHINEYLKKHDISMVEIPCLEDDMEKVRACLAEGVRVIALCTTWLQAMGGAVKTREAARLLKSLAPAAPVIAGGMGALKGRQVRELIRDGKLTGIFPRWIESNGLTRGLSSVVLKRILARHLFLMDARADRCIDAIALSDAGEITLRNVVEALRAGRDLRGVPGLAVPEGGEYRFTGEEEADIDLDAQTIDWAGYVDGLGDEEAPIRRGTGCPYKCAFCDFQGLQKLRVRSTESLLAEIQTLTGAGCRNVYFIDDNLAYTRKQLVEFAGAIIAARLNISWRGFVRTDIIDEETAALLQESGCREMLLGIESGDPQMLKNMDKGTDPDIALNAIQRLDAAGIRTQCTFVVGFPGETAGTLDRTAQFISSLPSGESAHAFHRYYLFKFTVSPLAPVAYPDQREKYALRGIAGNWSHRTMDSKEAAHAMRELFLNVAGPSHAYVETFSDDWDNASIRRVIELRDEVQKEQLRGRTAFGADKLLAAVRAAETK